MNLPDKDSLRKIVLKHAASRLDPQAGGRALREKCGVGVAAEDRRLPYGSTISEGHNF